MTTEYNLIPLGDHCAISDFDPRFASICAICFAEWGMF